jgi:hypothetical protein
MPLDPRKSHVNDRQLAEHYCRQASHQLDFALRRLGLAMQLDPHFTKHFLEKEVMGQLTTDWSVIAPNVLDAADQKTVVAIHAVAQAITAAQTPATPPAAEPATPPAQ